MCKTWRGGLTGGNCSWSLWTLTSLLLRDPLLPINVTHYISLTDPIWSGRKASPSGQRVSITFAPEVVLLMLILPCAGDTSGFCLNVLPKVDLQTDEGLRSEPAIELLTS